MRPEPQCEGVWAVFDPGSRFVAFTCDEGERNQVRVLDLTTWKSENVPGGGEAGGAIFFLPFGGHVFVNETGDDVSLEIRAKGRDPLTFPVTNTEPSLNHPAPRTVSSFAVQISAHDLEVRRGDSLQPAFPPIHIESCIRQFAYSGDGTTLAVAAGDCDETNSDASTEVVLYDTESGNERGRFVAKLRSRALVLSEDGRDVAMITSSYVGESAAARLAIFRDRHGTARYSHEWDRLLSSPTYDWLAFLPRLAGSKAAPPVAFIDRYDVHVGGDRGRELLRIVGGVDSFVLTNDRLIAAGDDTVSFWRLPQWEEPRRSSPSSKPSLWSLPAIQKFVAGRQVRHFAETDEGRYVLLAAYTDSKQQNYEVGLIDVSANRLLDVFPLQSNASSAAVAPDGSIAAAATTDDHGGAIVVRDVARRTTSRFEFSMTPGLAPPIAISPDAGILALGGPVVEVRDLRGNRRWQMEMDEHVSDLHFDPTGQRLVITSRRIPAGVEEPPTVITVTDTNFGTILYQAQSQFSVHRVTFSGASTLLIEDADHVTHTFEMDPLETAKAICRTVGTRLDAERWAELVRDSYVDTCRELLRPQSAPARVPSPHH